MYRTILAATRLFLLTFLVGGIVVAVGQAVGIATGSGPMVEAFGTSVADIACIVAGLAAMFAFLLLYTREGKAGRDDD